MFNVTASCYRKTFAFEGSKWLLDLHLADSSKSIHKFIIELHALLSLLVRGLTKKRGVELIQISQKNILFHPLWKPSTLGGNLIMWFPFLHFSKKAFLSPSVWARREHTWTLNWKESLLIYNEHCQDVPYSLE